MSTWNWKRHLPYVGVLIPVLTVLLLQWGQLEAFEMLVCQLLVLFGYFAMLYDLREKRVPNRLIGMMLGAWILIVVPQLFYQTESTLLFLLEGIVGFLIGGVLFLVVYVVSRKGLGGGDVKLMAVSGLYLGVDGILPTMLYGSVLASIYGISLLLLKKIDKGDSIPLVPFLYIGMLLTILVVL
ncbi:MAG: prepilin peptidase [Oscillospiraceae bacterium]|nr:prepilin peptidase [Oscillospiraceae bacterium]